MNQHLPAWAFILMERLVPYERRDAVVGDFAEVYQVIASEEGPARARLWVIWQLMKSFPSFFMGGLQMGSSMIGNYIRTAGRNIIKRKFHSALNMGGLTIGMVICLLILQYVVFETGYDSYHVNRDQLYRVNVISFQGDKQSGYDGKSFYAMAPIIKDAVPGVAEVVRIHPTYGAATIRTTGPGQQVFKLDELGYADPAFFSAFTAPALNGDPEGALESPDGVVLSRRAAERFFGTTDVLGRQLEVFSHLEGTFTIRSVIETMPANSHLGFDVILSLPQLLTYDPGQYARTNGWNWNNFVTYVQLQPGTDPLRTASLIDDVLRRSNEENWATRGVSYRMELQNVADIHLYSKFDDTFSTRSSYKTVLFLSIIGLFILVIAWLNYVNLSTARSLERAREVGIRKASGARRMQLVSQFLVESLVINVIALTVAVLVSMRALPVMNSLLGVDIPATIWRSPAVWLALFAIFGVGSVLASFYPAVVMSGYHPTRALRGMGAATPGGSRLKKTLVALQFTISIALLSGTYIVSRQVDFLRNHDLGFDLERVLVINRPTAITADADYDAARNAFLDELKSVKSVKHVTQSVVVPGQGFMSTVARRESESPMDAFGANAFWAGEGFLETYDIKLVAGRDLTDASPMNAALINEAAIEAFELGSAEAAMGYRLVVGPSRTVEVVGVTENYSWKSAKARTQPMFIFPTRNGGMFSMKLSSENMTQALSDIESLYERHFPGNMFDYFFADAEFDALFQAEQRLATMVRVFALFALLVAVLGLVGLAALHSAQRTREISIRKALGADAWSIAILLSRNFVVLILTGLVLAVPITWFLAEQWLADFASRISITGDLFVLPGLLVLLVAMGATAAHVIRAARRSPIAGIRAES